MRCINMTEKTRKLRFIDENRTKGLREGLARLRKITGFVRNSSPNDILISICLSFCYVDNLILQYIRYEMTPTSVDGEQHSCNFQYNQLFLESTIKFLSKFLSKSEDLK